MNCTKAVQEILVEIRQRMDSAQNLYRDSRNTENWIYWEGKWSGLIDAYKVVLAELAKVEKEVEK